MDIWPFMPNKRTQFVFAESRLRKVQKVFQYGFSMSQQCSIHYITILLQRCTLHEHVFDGQSLATMLQVVGGPWDKIWYWCGLGFELCELDPWPLTLTDCMDLTYIIGNKNLMIRWWEHSEKGVTGVQRDRRTDSGQTELFTELRGRSYKFQASQSWSSHQSKRADKWETISYLLFADADTGIYPHAASQYHARPKAKRGTAMLSVDKFPYPRKQTRGDEFIPCSNNICDILKRFRSFKIPAITLIWP